jgi:hypothetical protein
MLLAGAQSMEKKKTEEHALDTKASELLDSLSKVVTGSDSLPYDAASHLAASKGLAWALLRILVSPGPQGGMSIRTPLVCACCLRSLSAGAQSLSS